MTRIKQKSHYLAPRNWPIWLLIGLLRLLILLPFKMQIYLGQRLGRLAVHFSTKIRSTAATNLGLSFPELDASERQQLLKKNFEAVGVSIFETALGWWGSSKKLLPLVNITGLEHVQNALAKGNGAIICAAHFTSLHLAARLLALNFPVALMYRPQKNPVINKVIHKVMATNFKRAIQREQIRDMVRTLKNNMAICYTPDIDAGTQNSLFMPFFNIPTATITATSRLAKLTQTAVIPIEFYRRADNSGYEIELKPALENFPTDDLADDTLRINQHIEQAIRRFPEQYIWQYKRYKTRPEGEKRFYR